MAIALVANTAAGSGDTNSVTTSSIDTTGATLLIVGSVSGNSVSGSISDSKGNTWTPLTEYGSTGRSRLFYCVNPSVGSGHTFTNTATAGNPSIFVLALSGTATSSPFDVENGVSADTTGLTYQPGSVTPSQNNEVVVTLVGGRNSNPNTIDSGFTITDQVTTAARGSLAYLVQTTASAVNPTWTASGIGSNLNHPVIASFKAPAAATPKGGFFALMGTG